MSHRSGVKTKKHRKVNPVPAGESAKRHNTSLSSSGQVTTSTQPRITAIVKSVSYEGVLPELKRIGIIAGSVFLALVILYLMLR